MQGYVKRAARASHVEYTDAEQASRVAWKYSSTAFQDSQPVCQLTIVAAQSLCRALLGLTCLIVPKLCFQRASNSWKKVLVGECRNGLVPDVDLPGCVAYDGIQAHSVGPMMVGFLLDSEAQSSGSWLCKSVLTNTFFFPRRTRTDSMPRDHWR